MRIYWTLASIPELSGLSKSELRRRWQPAYRKAFGHWATWLALVTCALCAGLGARYGLSMNMGMIGALAGGLFGGFVFFQVLIAITRTHYRAILLGERTGRDEVSRA